MKRKPTPSPSVHGPMLETCPNRWLRIQVRKQLLGVPERRKKLAEVQDGLDWFDQTCRQGSGKPTNAVELRERLKQLPTPPGKVAHSSSRPNRGQSRGCCLSSSSFTSFAVSSLRFGTRAPWRAGGRSGVWSNRSFSTALSVKCQRGPVPWAWSGRGLVVVSLIWSGGVLKSHVFDRRMTQRNTVRTRFGGRKNPGASMFLDTNPCLDGN